MEGTKPFAISKQSVWVAYLKVKSNGGSSGIDEESMDRSHPTINYSVNNIRKLTRR